MAIVWREIQKSNITSLKKLSEILDLPIEQLGVPDTFPINIPLRLVEKMEKGSVTDPIFLQFVPLKKEKTAASFCADPVDDLGAQKAAKLLHKYPGRVLLLATSACAMHCRYCFRQNFPYEKQQSQFEEELNYIRDDPSIDEVILSGGDPLSLSNKILADLIENISQMPHVKRLRFHTRFPIGIPERIDSQFLAILEKCPLQIFFVIHINHPRELDTDLLVALKSVQKLGIPLLAQTVLLRGVNDSLTTLHGLCSALVNSGIIPYYLHQLDRVLGSEAFEVSESSGKILIEQLRASLSGYAIPSYVREIPGQKSKTPII